MRLSAKQRLVLSWWCEASPYRDREAIICDGAVRSGKTFAMTLSFFCWAMSQFNGAGFALCGVSAAAVRRNVLDPVRPALEELGFQLRERWGVGYIEVRFRGRENRVYLFGGGDKASAGRIQGITLAGVMLDEVTLMKREFVEQAVARCSDRGARVWFSCNPEGPEHWFYKEWVLRAQERRALRVRFVMGDNPALSRETLERYERSFRGAFYRRFVLGEWAEAEGRVYDFFDPERDAAEAPEDGFSAWRVSADYGTVNPASFGLWGLREGVWYRVREFYYDSRKAGRQRTDAEYAEDLERLAGGREIQRVIVDPSAASFMETLRRRGFRVVKADNDVADGIRVTADLLRTGRVVICGDCQDCLREIAQYCWERRGERDAPRKKDDHAMDDLRYFAMDLVKEREEDGFLALAVDRGEDF